MTHTGRLREVQLSRSLFKPNAMHGKYKRIKTEGGPTKQRLNSFNAYAAPYMVFYGYGYGDAAETKKTDGFITKKWFTAYPGLFSGYQHTWSSTICCT